MSDSQQSISTERALELLTKPQRRQILHQIASTPGGMTLNQFKKQLEAEDSMHRDGNNSVEHQGIELHHVHLPKLQEAGVIEYDPSQGTVHRGRQFEDVLSLLKVIEDHREETSTSIT